MWISWSTSLSNTAKRVVSLKDLRNNQINLVLWGNRGVEFDAKTVRSVGQDSPVIVIFVGMLLKSYKNENTLSGGSAFKRTINQEIPETESLFDRMYDRLIATPRLNGYQRASNSSDL